MTTDTLPRRVDHSALRVNQALIITFLVAAFVLNSPLIVGFVAIVMLLGTAAPRLALFQQFYRSLLKPAGLIQPHVIEDNPEPHRFAQGLGGVFVALGTLALVAGYPVLGWALVWLVVGLAAANLFLGFCAGCFVYYQLNRLGAPGFHHSRIGES
jgi:hypothetical protein